MALTAQLGPENATLHVRTARTGAAAKAGHDLLIEVRSWNATLDVGEDGTDTAVELTADPRSLVVVEASGGIGALSDEDKAGIVQTIDKEVLKGTPIAFHSTRVDRTDEQLSVRGELELSGQRHPLSFELTITPDGRLSGDAVVKQSNWGLKPYSALFGTLKVLDDVTVELRGQLPARNGHG
jgi:hypothetical protein